jgi:hypothetical protein
MEAACSNCGKAFRPVRTSARYCGPTCRVAAHRKTDCNANSTPHSPLEAPPASQNSSGVHRASFEPKNTSVAAKTLSVTRGFAIVPDAKWPGMYGLRRPDGTPTDMVNLTRAKDALGAQL